MADRFGAAPEGSLFACGVGNGVVTVSLATAQDRAYYRSARNRCLFFVILWSAVEALVLWLYLTTVPESDRFARYFFPLWLSFWSLSLALLVWCLTLTLFPYQPDRLILDGVGLRHVPGSVTRLPFFGTSDGIGFFLPELFRLVFGRKHPFAVKWSLSEQARTFQQESFWSLAFGTEGPRLRLPLGTSEPEAAWVAGVVNECRRTIGA